MGKVLETYSKEIPVCGDLNQSNSMFLRIEDNWLRFFLLAVLQGTRIVPLLKPSKGDLH